MVVAEYVERKHPGSVAGACVYPMKMEPTVDEILDVNLEFVLRLDESVMCQRKVIDCLSGPISPVGTYIQDMFRIKPQPL
jgi:hypothetical protein